MDGVMTDTLTGHSRMMDRIILSGPIMTNHGFHTAHGCVLGHHTAHHSYTNTLSLCQLSAFARKWSHTEPKRH